MENNEEIIIPDYEEELAEILRSNLSDAEILEQLDNYHENDIAGALELLTVEERKRLYHVLGAERVSEIFTYIDDVDDYIGELNIQSAARVIENMDSDDAVDVLEELDEDERKNILRLLDRESREDIALITSYEEDEIGSKMTTNFIEISKNLTIKEAMKSMIAQAEDNDNISTIYVTDENEKFYGALDLKDLIIARTYVDLESLITTSYPYVRDHEQISDCIERLKDYAEDSIPVLNNEDEIIGVITSQDIVEVVDDEMGEDYAKLAGLTEEEDLEESLADSIKKRLPWLVVLLFLAMGVSSVVGVFESVVSKIALVVCFQSMILGMAGNVGTQSLAVTIRVLIDEELDGKEIFRLIMKEVKVGFCNGLILGILSFVAIGIYIYMFKVHILLNAFAISGCVGIALLVAMTVSSLIGTVVPIFFTKIKVDPAVASGPLISTVNDLTAVVIYYSMVWVLVINVLKLVQ